MPRGRPVRVFDGRSVGPVAGGRDAGTASPAGGEQVPGVRGGCWTAEPRGVARRRPGIVPLGWGGDDRVLGLGGRPGGGEPGRRR